MALGKKFLAWSGLLLSLLLSACSSGSSGGAGNVLLTVSQDLTLDPTGMTTVITFQTNLPAGVTAGNFTADGGQTALAVVVLDEVARVTWDQRVTPSHEVQTVTIPGVVDGSFPVTTTDPNPPTFAVTAATQVAGLGGDTITVQFSGANVIKAMADAIANWSLVVNGVSMDLTGSTFDLDEGTQILAITLGPGANLHATFDLAALNVASVADVALAATPQAGAATGDTVAPTHSPPVQNLVESEFGFVVDFTFSEAMDPIFATQLSNFDAGFPVFASQVEQLPGTPETLRVTFNNPIVPGYDTITFGAELFDVHGNPVVDPGGPVAVTAGSTPDNDYDGTPVLDTVEDAGGDTLTVLLTQALDPDVAEEFARWDVQSPTGTSLDLSGATFSYDLLSKTMTITLAEDLVTGDSFQVGPGAGPLFPVDVDGQDFLDVIAGTVTGDSTAPFAILVGQNRTVDPTGLTLDIVLSEDIAGTVPGDWTVTGGATVDTATLTGSDRVRLTLTGGFAMPGVDTLSVANLTDLAGNAMPAPQTGLPIVSTDQDPPTAGLFSAFAFAGADNDEIQVTFDDDMLEAEVEDPLSWVVEMPVGTPLDTTNASVDYNPFTRTAVLTFDGGDQVDLKVRQSIQLSLSNMHDLGGNLVDGTPIAGVVDGEGVYPTLEAVWVETLDPSRLHVQFSEPCDELDDIAGFTAYVVRDDLGAVVGGPAAVTIDPDRAGATLFLGFGATAGFHTLDVRGVTDLAGNQIFPVDLFPIVAEDLSEPALDPGLSVVASVSGEENDVLTIEFDRPMSSWGIDDPLNYDLTAGGPSANLSDADYVFDGDATVTINLDGPFSPDVQTGVLHALLISGLRSAQGVDMTGPSGEAVVCTGDSTAAAQTALRTRIDAANPADSILIEFDEATDPVAAETAANFLKGGVVADSATRVGHRTVRAVWSGGVLPGDSIDVTMTDLAGNVGVTNQLAQAATTVGPVLLSVDGVIQPGFGGDEVRLGFSVPIEPGSAGTIANYAVDQGGNPVDLTGAALRYVSATNTVAIQLASGVELDPFQTVHVLVDNVTNQDGIAISPQGDLTGSVTGDTTPPDFAVAFVNFRESATAQVVDVLFTEDVDPAFAGTPANFTASGGQTVTGATLLAPDILRLSLSAPLIDGDTIDTVGIEDAAGVAAGAISIAPDF